MRPPGPSGREDRGYQGGSPSVSGPAGTTCWTTSCIRPLRSPGCMARQTNLILRTPARPDGQGGPEGTWQALAQPRHGQTRRAVHQCMFRTGIAISFARARHCRACMPMVYMYMDSVAAATAPDRHPCGLADCAQLCRQLDLLAVDSIWQPLRRP